MKYEGTPVQKSSSNVKTNIILCMFLFSVAFHVDYIRLDFFCFRNFSTIACCRNPWLSRSEANLLQADPPKVLDHHGRNLLWAADDVLEKNGSNFSPFSMCPASINQTESARLALELER